MDTIEIEIIEPKAKGLLDEMVNLNLIKFKSSDTEDARRTYDAADLRALFKTTQSLPLARTISEEEIAAEIVAYREGK